MAAMMAVKIATPVSHTMADPMATGLNHAFTGSAAVVADETDGVAAIEAGSVLSASTEADPTLAVPGNVDGKRGLFASFARSLRSCDAAVAIAAGASFICGLAVLDGI